MSIDGSSQTISRRRTHPKAGLKAALELAMLTVKMKGMEKKALKNLTKGIDHVGLTVASLTPSLDFFINALGFTEIGGKPDYPAVYVSDGTATLTLWQTSDPGDYIGFDRRRNIGLHHLALAVTSSVELDDLFAKVRVWNGVQVEFAPEYSGAGPKRHFMISEPGGNRIEFSWDPRKC